MPIEKSKNKVTLSVFELIFLVWSGGIILSIALAILGIFYPAVIWAYLLLSVLVIWRLQKKKCGRSGGAYPLAGRIVIKKMPTVEKLLLGGLIIFTIFLSSFTVPTIFGGRDEGSLFNSALLINQNHNLNYESKLITIFGTIYGEGRALNFPGFFYQKDSSGKVTLKSQFLPGYSSYLANFAQASNLSLLKFANALPLIIFLLSFYLILKQLTKSTESSLLGTILLVSVVPIGLFYKFTLSEIFFASLIWPSLYFLIKYLQNKNAQHKNFYYWLIFIPLLPTVFTRIESLGIIFALVLILIFKSHQRLQKPGYQTPLLLLTLLSVISLFIFSDFFIIAIKGLLGSLTNDPTQAMTSSIVPKNWQDFYLLKVFYSYNLIPIFFFASLGLWRLFREKAWLMLIPLFFLGITGIYLIDANISLDHPWMLRRFIFSITPLAVLYTVIFLQRYPLRRKFLHTIIIIILIISNVLLALEFVTFKQNNGLIPQIATLSQEFTKNDLILISQKFSGSGWSMISEPLRNVYQRQAVYFFNPQDYARLDKSQFDKIYLLVSDKEIELYRKEFSLEKIKNYTIKNQIIEPTKIPLQSPKFILTKTKGALYGVK